MLILININVWNYCCSITKSCPTLCDPMNCSMPGFPDFHHLLGFAQTDVHWVNLLQYIIFNSLWSKRVWGTDFIFLISSSWEYFCMFLFCFLFLNLLPLGRNTGYIISVFWIFLVFVFLKSPFLDMLIYSSWLQ